MFCINGYNGAQRNCQSEFMRLLCVLSVWARASIFEVIRNCLSGDPELSAAYYARVLEIPTPRWTAYEARRFGIKMKKEIPMVTVERAYTSPIWYTP